MAAADELRELDDASLLERLAEAKDDLFKRRFNLATGQLENTALIPRTKREIARINTELRAREIRAAEAMEAGK
ncbi:MAG: 50S ribosomal protein L29 [Acidimicrobiia bacterium]|jgi:large subunit ribosomal protein L29